MASLFELSVDLLATVGPDGRFGELSPSWEHTLEWTRRDLKAHLFIEFVHPDDRERLSAVLARAGAAEHRVVQLDARFAHLDGSWRRLHWRVRFDGDTHYIAAKDLTERKSLEQRAIHDPLTGLPNRTLVMDRLSHALHRKVRAGGSVAVLFIDLDRFKAVNDTRGHEVGDAVLVAAARRLESMVRGEDTVGRLSGDEFVVIAESLDDDPRAEALAHRIVEGFKLPLSAGEEQVVVGASVGMVLADQRAGATPERLLREADSAMYQAKAAGRGRSELFDNEMRRDVAERLNLARELQHALPRGGCGSSTSRSCRSATAWSSRAKRSCAGTTLSVGSCPPRPSCRSPSRTA